MDNQTKKWYQTWRIIYPLLGLVLIVELVFGLKTLLTPLPKSKVQSIQPITGASILLSADKTNYTVGETIPVKVRVWTGGHNTSGTDLSLRFDPKILEATSAAFTRGKIYADFPFINIDSKNGIIKVSAVIATNKQAFNGIGELGVINFTAKKVGQTMLTVDFKKGATNDSNVIGVAANEDLLDKVNNLKITVQK